MHYTSIGLFASVNLAPLTLLLLFLLEASSFLPSSRHLLFPLDQRNVPRHSFFFVSSPRFSLVNRGSNWGQRSRKHVSRDTFGFKTFRVPYRHSESFSRSFTRCFGSWRLQPYQADTDPNLIRGSQQGYNLCNSTTEGQSSLCQTSFLNALDGMSRQREFGDSEVKTNRLAKIFVFGHRRNPIAPLRTRRVKKSLGARSLVAGRVTFPLEHSKACSS